MASQAMQQHNTVLTLTPKTMERGNFDPYRTEPLNQSMDKKSGTVDYIHRTTSHTEFGENPFTRQFRQIGEIQ